MYPRASRARTDCLTELTLARRKEIQKSPERAGAQRLLHELTETGRMLAFRDDRGVVVNFQPERSADGGWGNGTTNLLTLIAQTSAQHPEFPLLVVGHSAERSSAEEAEETARAIAEELQRKGAKQVSATSVGSDQPLIDRRIRGADGKNQRVEIIFVTPAR
jgi:outer membrane protein OmpA-like peptidoglycan-associated protein